MGVFTLLLIYFIVDMLLQVHWYVTDYPYLLIIACALSGGSLAYVISKALGAASSTPVVFFVLFGLGFSLAGTSGFLRINQLTDVDGFDVVPYEFVKQGHFSPLQEGFPEIRYRDFPIPGHELQAGDVFDFHLIKGICGFWQVDISLEHFVDQAKAKQKDAPEAPAE